MLRRVAFPSSPASWLPRSLHTTPALDLPTPALRRQPIVYHHLRRPLPYSQGLLLQEHLVSRRLSAQKALRIGRETGNEGNEAVRRVADTDILLLLEHKPVYTAGRREKDLESTLREGERLRALGADYVTTMRGGQTTFHGPGQLVGYPIIDLNASSLTTRSYVELLEGFLASLVKAQGLSVVLPSPHTGVFTDMNHKIGSIGIHIQHRITSHGFALNVESSVLDWFSHIVACGLSDVTMTSVETELMKLGRGKKVKVADLVESTVSEYSKAFDREIIEMGAGEEHASLRDVIADAVARRLLPLQDPI